MKLAIDAYCYHRYFGEVYPNLENDPGFRMGLTDILDRAAALKVEGVSLESCFFSDMSLEDADEVKSQLDRFGFERVWAWGHLSGLHSGAAPEQLLDLKHHTQIAARIGAKVMRICCGSRRTRPKEWADHKAALLPLLLEAVRHSEEHGIVLAIENHIDFLADELVELIETVNSPWLGVCLDTANNLRVLEDPLEAALKLVPYARMTHVKDIRAGAGNPHDFSFWPSVPLGQGIINIPVILQALRSNGYDGLLALEIDYLHPAYANDEKAIADSIAHLRGLL